MAEDDETCDLSTFDASSVSVTDIEMEKSRSCRGCLLYSRSLMDARRNPICIGLGGTENRVYSMVGESEQDASKEGRRLTDFKYACIGYSIHKEKAATSGAMDGAELPLCVGLEFLADRRPQGADNQSSLEQLQQDEARPPIMPQPPTMRRPTAIGGMSGDEFASRFVRCAGLVGSAVVRNMSYMLASVKTGLDDIMHDRRRPK